MLPIDNDTIRHRTRLMRKVRFTSSTQLPVTVMLFKIEQSESSACDLCLILQTSADKFYCIKQ